jgi:tripartite-type tricarboxylate transporter receptor subunit TctC
LGQQVIVDNRGGIIPAVTVAQAAPDGYTFLVHGSTIWLSPFLHENLPNDPIRDLSPVTWAVSQPNVLVVHSSVPASSVRELILLAKKHPGVLNYASSATGGTPHLAGELFRSMAGVNVVRINYKGVGAALNAQITGEVHMMFSTTSSVVPHVKAGRLRALAVTSAQPSDLAPGLPTVSASGVPGYEVVSILGMFAPAGTPAQIIERVNSEIVRYLNTPDIKDRFLKSGVEVVASSPQQLAAIVKSEMAKWGKILTPASQK